MDRFQSLQLFVRVVENNSFSATATEFSLGQATVSKQISELEHELKTKLLTRTTRRLSLTEAGEKFYHQAKAIVEQYQFAVGEVRNLKQKPAGIVRLATPIFFGRTYITPILAKFCELYPEIVIDHYLGDSFSNLVQEGIDVTVRIGEMEDSTHVARKIGTLHMVTAASKGFLKKVGVPTHPRELEKLPCVVYTGFETPFHWNYTDAKGKDITVKVSGPYRSNTTEAIRTAAIAGMGFLRGSTSMIADELKSGKLVSVLGEFETETTSVYLVTPASAYLPEKTKVLIDFIQQEFKKNPLFDLKAKRS